MGARTGQREIRTNFIGGDFCLEVAMPGIGIWVVVGPKSGEVSAAMSALNDAGATVTEVQLVLQSAGERSALPLTQRQREVLALIAHGLSNRQIAATLHLAPSTIANLISSLLGLTGAHNRAELASLAVLSGVLEEEPGAMAC